MNVGMNIIERDSADAARVVPSDIFSMGMAFTSRRGPVDVAVPIYNPTDDKKVFGEYGSSYLGGFMRRGLYANCREFGATVWGGRVIGASGSVSATKTFNDATKASWVFTSGWYGHPSPGADGCNVYIEIKVNVADANKRDVIVSYKGPKDSAPVQKEVHEYLDNTSVVNEFLKKSGWVICALATGATTVPVVAAQTALVGGLDGVAPTDSDYVAAYSRFNGINIPLIMNADLHAIASAQSLQTYVEGLGVAIGLIASPQAASITTLASTYAPLLKSKSYLVGTRGWGNVDDENGGVIAIPMMAHAVGAAWIRKCVQRGGFPWIAPAGDTTALRDVYELEFPFYSATDVNNSVAAGFNPVQWVQGKGFIVRTSRTFSTLRKHYSAHVRRMTNWMIASFQGSFMWLEQEPPVKKTYDKLSDSLTFFAQDVYKNGGLNTRGGYENNAKVKCDEENNTQEIADNGGIVADFSFHPVEAIESGTINIFQTRDDLKVTEK
jgi:hypothetical protein